ncbi:homoserine kinase [Pedobacter antarcticus]|uniref:Homoserine kinase n=2 Tax=Pedobacter antarcticus TaxID=34086 RepID=A0A081PGR4_9SPHI|nr:homoserine kinase [Pedobacter antarcticus]KEQ29887.1 serine kinase [Pedobacter antarcticus 4BY]SDM14570.1 homoserine kinase [Pedobacter antarcticus]SFF14841.1 homoserine kinase [Pedobacter antarcticus]
MRDSVKVFAPATVANVVCGFDVLGFAVNAPGDEVIMRLVDEPGVKITKITGDDGRLPLDPAKNTVSASVQDYLKHIGREDAGITIELHKKMPIGSGLGSSSASTVAGLFAVNTLFGNLLSRKELVPFAMKGEELACGYGHADNVAPALMGGFVLVRSYEPLDVISLPFPEDLCAAIVYPEVDVPTKDARQMIRSKVFLKDAVKQWGNVAGLVSGLYTSDYDLIGRSMVDVLVEPVRSILIPEFYAMRQLAMDLGAVGFGISGSGPSVFALTRNQETARKITDALQARLKTVQINSLSFVSPVNAKGPVVLD